MDFSKLITPPLKSNSVELTEKEIKMAIQIKYQQETDSEVVLDYYVEDVKAWHKIMLGTFDADAFRLYTVSPMLILQELEETINAIQTNDYVEVLDGLFDTYWELIPCVKYLTDQGIKLPESLEADGVVIDLETLKKLHSTLKYLQAGVTTTQSLPNLMGMWVLETFSVISFILDYIMCDGKINGVAGTVVASNFSKFLPADITISQLQKIKDLTASKYNCMEFQIQVEISKGDSNYVLLKNVDGKVLKPVGVFFEPDIASNVKSFNRTVDFVELMNSEESI